MYLRTFLCKKWRGIWKCMLSSTETTLTVSKRALNLIFLQKIEIRPWLTPVPVDPLLLSSSLLFSLSSVNIYWLKWRKMYTTTTTSDNDNINFWNPLDLFTYKKTYATYFTNKSSGKTFADICHPTIHDKIFFFIFIWFSLI